MVNHVLEEEEEVEVEVDKEEEDEEEGVEEEDEEEGGGGVIDTWGSSGLGIPSYSSAIMKVRVLFSRMLSGL